MTEGDAQEDEEESNSFFEGRRMMQKQLSDISKQRLQTVTWNTKTRKGKSIFIKEEESYQPEAENSNMHENMFDQEEDQEQEDEASPENDKMYFTKKYQDMIRQINNMKREMEIINEENQSLLYEIESDQGRNV